MWKKLIDKTDPEKIPIRKVTTETVFDLGRSKEKTLFNFTSHDLDMCNFTDDKQINGSRLLFNKGIDLEANQAYSLSFLFSGIPGYKNYKITKEKYPVKRSVQVKEGEIELIINNPYDDPILDMIFLITL